MKIKKKILDTLDDGLKWMESNTDATKEDYEKKQKEVEEIVTPIIQKLGGGMGGGGMGGFNPEDFQNFQKENTENKEDKKEEESKPKFEDLDVD